MNKNTYIWTMSLLIAVLYLGFGLPMIVQIGFGELTSWGVIFGIILGVTPILGLLASSTSNQLLRTCLAALLGTMNLIAALVMLAGAVLVIVDSAPQGFEDLFGAVMLFVSLAAFTVNTAMCFRILKNISVMEGKSA